MLIPVLICAATLSANKLGEFSELANWIPTSLTESEMIGSDPTGLDDGWYVENEDGSIGTRHPRLDGKTFAGIISLIEGCLERQWVVSETQSNSWDEAKFGPTDKKTAWLDFMLDGESPRKFDSRRFGIADKLMSFIKDRIISHINTRFVDFRIDRPGWVEHDGDVGKVYWWTTHRSATPQDDSGMWNFWNNQSSTWSRNPFVNNRTSMPCFSHLCGGNAEFVDNPLFPSPTGNDYPASGFIKSSAFPDDKEVEELANQIEISLPSNYTLPYLVTNAFEHASPYDIANLTRRLDFKPIAAACQIMSLVDSAYFMPQLNYPSKGREKRGYVYADWRKTFPKKVTYDSYMGEIYAEDTDQAQAGTNDEWIVGSSTYDTEVSEVKSCNSQIGFRFSHQGVQLSLITVTSDPFMAIKVDEQMIIDALSKVPTTGGEREFILERTSSNDSKFAFKLSWYVPVNDPPVVGRYESTEPYPVYIDSFSGVVDLNASVGYIADIVMSETVLSPIPLPHPTIPADNSELVSGGLSLMSHGCLAFLNDAVRSLDSEMGCEAENPDVHVEYKTEIDTGVLYHKTIAEKIGKSLITLSERFDEKIEQLTGMDLRKDCAAIVKSHEIGEALKSATIRNISMAIGQGDAEGMRIICDSSSGQWIPKSFTLNGEKVEMPATLSSVSLTADVDAPLSVDLKIKTMNCGGKVNMIGRTDFKGNALFRKDMN